MNSPLPDWAQELNDTTDALLVQVNVLRSREYAEAEAGLLLQVAENVDCAARLLRDIASSKELRNTA